MKFLDQAKIYVKAGNGGSGLSSFRSLLNLGVLMGVMEDREDLLF